MVDAIICSLILDGLNVKSSEVLEEHDSYHSVKSQPPFRSLRMAAAHEKEVFDGKMLLT